MDHSGQAPKVAIVMGTGAGGVRALTGDLEPAAVSDAVTVRPDLTGHVGRAWRLDLADFRKALGRSEQTDAAVAGWVIEAAWAHPVWHSYLISLVHLRPLPGQPEPDLAIEAASHQFWLFALDPAEPREAVLRGQVRPSMLWPANFAAQLAAPDDDTAIGFVEAAVLDICGGQLSPDTDYLHAWADRFGDNMLKR